MVVCLLMMLLIMVYLAIIIIYYYGRLLISTPNKRCAFAKIKSSKEEVFIGFILLSAQLINDDAQHNNMLEYRDRTRN